MFRMFPSNTLTLHPSIPPNTAPPPHSTAPEGVLDHGVGEVVGARHIMLVEGGQSLHHLLCLVDLGHVDESTRPDPREEAVLSTVVGDELTEEEEEEKG